MGNKRYDDDDDFRSNKRLKHSRNIKGQGMRELNTYDEDEWDDDPWNNEVGVSDEISITITRGSDTDKQS